MAQRASEASESGSESAWRRHRRRAPGAVIFFCVLLAAPRARGGDALPAAARSAAELIPDGSRFFLDVDLGALKEHGPQDAVRRAVSTLAPLASESGLSAERLRSIVMANAEESLNGDKLPSWLLFAQDGAPPLLNKLESAFRRYTRAPIKPASAQGLAYRGNRDLSLVQLPLGPTLLAGAAGPGEIVAAWQGKSATPLLRSPRAELLQRVAGERPTTFRVWLTLTGAMQRSLVEDAHVPAAPLEVASALRLLPDRGAELWVLVRCSDEDTAKQLASWLSARLGVLAASAEVKLLGLAGYLQASKIASDGPLARLQLALSSADMAALLDRAIGMLATLVPRPVAPVAPEPASRPASAQKSLKSSQKTQRNQGQHHGPAKASSKAVPEGARR